ncbi:hypothetical protein BT96DRAFT_1010155 [Gymnopus androsaceus JB14]|uniref:Uncharacterized protein n=1 Tax=Gymnopus androsaceus JB14 TaxID=1447944 RepID=A0A6A4GB54_9AGAR|nr:hypothetical protein BT96DRAFT_1010155 [Gymnopus androsaceus JB14]
MLLGDGIYEQTTIQYQGSAPEELEALLANEVARTSLAANKNPEQREIENALRLRNQLTGGLRVSHLISSLSSSTKPDEVPDDLR